MNGQRQAYWAHSRALITRDKGWIKPILVLGAALLVPIAGLIGVMGYVLEWARLIAWGVDASPKQRNVNVGECMASGWRGFVVALAYALVASLVNVLVTMMFGDNFFTNLLTSLFSFAMGIMGSLAALHAAIYQKISAGFSFDRFAELLKRDKEGFARAVLAYVLVSLVIGCALGLLYSVAIMPIAVRLSYSLAGFDLMNLRHLTSSEFRYVMGEIMRAIAAEAPVLAVLLYVSSAVVAFTMLVQYTALALWLRQFNVPAWGSEGDPLPGSYAGLPAAGGAYGQPSQGQPYGQNGYGQPYGYDARGQANGYQQPYGQQPNAQQPYGQPTYGQQPYVQQPNAQQPYGQPGYPQQTGSYAPQSGAQPAQQAGQTGYVPTQQQSAPTMVPVPLPIGGQSQPVEPPQTANPVFQMPPVQGKTGEQAAQVPVPDDQPVQVAQPYVPASADEQVSAETPSSFFNQVQAMEGSLSGAEPEVQDAPIPVDAVPLAVPDADVAERVEAQVDDRVSTPEAVEPKTESYAIPEPIILPPAATIASPAPQASVSANTYQVSAPVQEPVVEATCDDDPIEVGDIIGAQGERVVEVISLSGAPRPKRVSGAATAEAGSTSTGEDPAAAPADGDATSLPEDGSESGEA